MEKPQTRDHAILNDLRVGVDYVGLATKYGMSAEEFVSFHERNSHELASFQADLLDNALHPLSCIMAFIENTLPDETIPIIERHLAVCRKCNEEAEELKKIISDLRTFKHEIFCPEPWECYNFALDGPSTDPKHADHDHIARCNSCRAEVEEIQSAAQMPEAIAEAFRRNYGRTKKNSFFSDMVRRGLRYFADNRAFSSVAAAAAAVMLIFVIYPATDREPFLALSTVQWEHSGGSLIAKDFSAKKPKTRMAVIIELKDSELFSDAYVNELYKAADPSRSSEFFDFISPSDIREFVENHNLNPLETEPTIKAVMERMNAWVLVMSIDSAGSRCSITTQLMEPGKTARLLKQTVSDQNELLFTIKELSKSSIESSISEKERLEPK